MVSSSFLLVGVYMREVDDGWILQFSFGRNIFVKCIYAGFIYSRWFWSLEAILYLHKLDVG